MKRPYTRQRLFSRLSSGRTRRGSSTARASKTAETSPDLPLRSLGKISFFETLRAYQGVVFHFDEHLQRLSESSQSLGIALPAAVPELKAWVRASLRESGFRDAVLRLSIHPVSSDLDPACLSDGFVRRIQNARGTAVVVIRPFRSHPRGLYEKGVRLATAVNRRWTLKAQDPQIKASQFLSGVLAHLDRIQKPARELLLLGQAGVAEGTVSNFFILDPAQKRLLTPSAASGILRGVTRAVVMDLARRKGIPVVETVLCRHQIYTARECFITNTSSEILPVVEVDGRRIGTGRPGPVTRALAREFKKSVQKMASNKHA